MSDTFIDPVDEKDLDSLIKRLGDFENPDNLLKFIQKLKPGWIIDTAVQASCNLATLNRQWAMTCAAFKTEPQKVLLVRDTFMNERGKETQHKLIHAMADNLTRLGFFVRDEIHLSKCKGCQELIPSKFVTDHHKMDPIEYCSNCDKIQEITNENN